MSTKKLLVAIIVVLLILVALYSVTKARIGDDASTETPTNTTPRTVTIRGNVVCLPHKDKSITTEECMRGLYDPSTKLYYSLGNLPQDARDVTEVTGTLKPDTQRTYDTAGLIDVSSFKSE